ncbi:hypothetical protein [Azonexus sp.]|jgi:hypothetical protein|uniref:hypothetical protein n=1 Tax=Azonexus sp. TaxID=1872668 RepID=UPI002832A6E1|nr:hypothetical protein [Azonexus sp.]MDR1996073.1 hypothetical protein [Azonexus sp.]
MKLTPSWLAAAAQRGIITDQQANALWAFAEASGDTDTPAPPPDVPAFRPAHILYYLGGLVAIGAMTLFMTLGWERFGHDGLLAITIGYALIGLVVTEWLLRQKLRIPAGITAAFTLALVPLAVYALQGALGLWSDDRNWAYRDYHRWIDVRWLVMELSTLAAGAVMLWRYRLPFLVMPIAVTLWYMSMDFSRLLAASCDGSYGCDDWNLYKTISTLFGLAVLVVALVVDLRASHARRAGRDYAFWLYLAGLMAFWGGLTSMNSDSEWGKFGYLCINLLLIAAGAVLSRRAFAVFGGMGVAVYLGHLAWDVFQNSMMFPFVLSLIGFAIIGLGILWQRREQAITQRLRGLLPQTWREKLEADG